MYLPNLKSVALPVPEQWRIQDLPRGGDHGESAEREPKRGPGGGAPSGVQGQSPWWGVRGLKLKAFCTFLCKNVQKAKDLSENLPRV